MFANEDQKTWQLQNPDYLRDEWREARKTLLITTFVSIVLLGWACVPTAKAVALEKLFWRSQVKNEPQRHFTVKNGSRCTHARSLLRAFGVRRSSPVHWPGSAAAAPLTGAFINTSLPDESILAKVADTAEAVSKIASAVKDMTTPTSSDGTNTSKPDKTSSTDATTPSTSGSSNTTVLTMVNTSSSNSKASSSNSTATHQSSGKNTGAVTAKATVLWLLEGSLKPWLLDCVHRWLMSMYCINNSVIVWFLICQALEKRRNLNPSQVAVHAWCHAYNLYRWSQFLALVPLVGYVLNLASLPHAVRLVLQPWGIVDAVVGLVQVGLSLWLFLYHRSVLREFSLPSVPAAAGTNVGGAAAGSSAAAAAAAAGTNAAAVGTRARHVDAICSQLKDNQHTRFFAEQGRNAKWTFVVHLLGSVLLLFFLVVLSQSQVVIAPPAGCTLSCRVTAAAPAVDAYSCSLFGNAGTHIRMTVSCVMLFMGALFSWCIVHATEKIAARSQSHVSREKISDEKMDELIRTFAVKWFTQIEVGYFTMVFHALYNAIWFWLQGHWFRGVMPGITYTIDVVVWALLAAALVCRIFCCLQARSAVIPLSKQLADNDWRIVLYKRSE